jgi:hypothetical protein
VEAVLDLLLEQRPYDGAWNARNKDKPQHLIATLEHINPVSREICHDSDKRAEVKGDVEDQIRFTGDMPSGDPVCEREVRGTADGQELSGPLDDAKDDCL